jgi:hypothetical protein
MEFALESGDLDLTFLFTVAACIAAAALLAATLLVSNEPS